VSDKIISSNSKICKNTILYFLGMQIPENYKYLINFQINLKKLINSGQYFNQIVTPNFSDLNYKFKKLDPILGVNTFVIGYIAKIIDINILNILPKTKLSPSNIKKIYFDTLDKIYNVNGSEILNYIIFNNKNLTLNKNIHKFTLNFGVGSFAAILDYIEFQKYNNLNQVHLYNFLKEKDNENLINKLNATLYVQFNNKEIDKNKLFINSLCNCCF